MLSLDSKYLLSAAFMLAGDKKRYYELLPSSFTGEESVAQTGGSFYSDVRDESLALNALLEVDPSNAQIPRMSAHVAALLKNRSWFSTQEASFSLIAMGKIAKAARQSTVTGAVFAGGKKLADVFDKKVSFRSPVLNSSKIELVTKGQGRMYYSWNSEGIPIGQNIHEEDSYIKVRRKLFSRNGQLINSSQFKQNDLIIVQLTLENMYATPVDNIVISDLLPAGFEIENARIREVSGMNWLKDANEPSALDVRDDRINLFVDLNKQRQVYYYAVRAVAAGSFNWGAAGAEAMYQGEYHSYNGSRKIMISK